MWPDQEPAAEGVLALLRELVRHPTTQAGDEVMLALEALLEFLRKAGVSGKIISSAEVSAPMAAATITGDAPGPAILFQGHLDVVPADIGWHGDPFSGNFTGGQVHGRGTVDMKGGITAFAAAMTGIRARGLPRGSVTLLVDSDEETGSDHGLIPYIATHGLAGYDWAICGEPTGLPPTWGTGG